MQTLLCNDVSMDAVCLDPHTRSELCGPDITDNPAWTSAGALVVFDSADLPYAGDDH